MRREERKDAVKRWEETELQGLDKLRGDLESLRQREHEKLDERQHEIDEEHRRAREKRRQQEEREHDFSERRGGCDGLACDAGRLRCKPGRMDAAAAGVPRSSQRWLI